MIKQYITADVYALPFADESFDVVIINHVLMYLNDVKKALKEIHRVLSKGGRIYCSTIAKDMMHERDELIAKFDAQISYQQNILYDRFGFENGKEQLEQYFHSVKMDDRYEIYTIDQVQDYYNFILSANGLGDHLNKMYKHKEEFLAFMKQEYKTKGNFKLTVHAGMFEAMKGEEISD